MAEVADVRTFLIAQGLVDGATGWPLSEGRIHDESDKLVVLTEDGGAAPRGVPSAAGVGSGALLDPAVQVYVRGDPFDREPARVKAQEIFDALLLAPKTIGANDYMRVAPMTSGLVFVGYEEDRGRPQFTVSYRFMKPAV